MRIDDLGLIGFADALAIQERAVADIACRLSEERLLLLEHTPVYTIGSGGDTANILDPHLPVVRINRGGDVTWHGPGQVVGYPLLDLTLRGRDLHRCLRFIEELVIHVVARFGVAAHRVDGRTGVWTGRGKLASIGVGVRRWVTMHGFALNVAADLRGFLEINPCGIKGCPITSLERETGAAIGVPKVKEAVAACFIAVLEEFLPLSKGDEHD